MMKEEVRGDYGCGGYSAMRTGLLSWCLTIWFNDRHPRPLAASEYTLEALEVMVRLMRKSKQDSIRLAAANCILDRAVGRAPMQIDVGALRHDEIVYQSAEEIRAELQRRGVPLLLIEHSIDAEIVPDAESESPPTQSE
jgi:hypothetical protein